ncbi:hypothetical protein TcG_04437 [Trypanosoma cruzi]|nr:hypothetical protein TcG_04437 [Trypanosoma cruzi]
MAACFVPRCVPFLPRLAATGRGLGGRPSAFFHGCSTLFFGLPALNPFLAMGSASRGLRGARGENIAYGSGCLLRAFEAYAAKRGRMRASGVSMKPSFVYIYWPQYRARAPLACARLLSYSHAERVCCVTVCGGYRCIVVGVSPGNLLPNNISIAFRRHQRIEPQ